MSKFSVISGTTNASSCNIKADRLQLVSGMFNSEDLLLISVQVSTDGLVPPNPKLVRFFLRHSEREWLCEASTSVFAELQALLYKFHNPAPPAPPTSKLKTWGLIIGGFFLLVFLAKACDRPNSSVPAKSDGVGAIPKSTVSTSPLMAKDKIRASVLDPYTKEQYSKTFAKFGSRMPDVEKARKASALLAAKSDKCLRVEMSEISTLSSTRNDIHTFVDCRGANGQSERFRFAEADLKDKNGRFYTDETVKQVEKPATIKDQAVSHESALAMCKSSVTKNAKFPSSVEFSWLDQIVRTSDGSGETWVELPFEAKNALGGILPQKATCTFPINGKPTIKIENR